MSLLTSAPVHSDAASSTVIKRDWLDATIRLATSWVGLFTAYVVAITLGLTKYKAFTGGLEQAGLPPWSGIALIVAFPACALLFSTIPSILDQRRVRRSEGLKVRAGAYFTLRPRDTEEGFERADQAHFQVLRWIQGSKEPVFYLTGASGTGKSSLLTAWVVPKLQREGHLLIQLRGYEDFFEGIRNGVLAAGLWVKPPAKEADVSQLLQRACERLNGRRLIIVVDQFEEFLILKDQQQQSILQQFFSLTKIDALSFLLVYRPEYEPLLLNQAWPKIRLDANRRVIAAFTENEAMDFLQKSGITLNAGLTRAILREAAEIEQGTVGLIRPVTINLCGLVLSRFSDGLPRGFRGGIIRGFLRESLRLPEVQDIAGKVFPLLITNNITKQPRTISELAELTGLQALFVRACLRRLGESDRAIVRPLDQEQEAWEISHDFLVPLLDAMIARGTSSLWRRVRPWLPWIAAAVLATIGAVAPWAADPRAALINQGWTVTGVVGRSLEVSRKDFDGKFSPQSVSILRSLPSPYTLDVRFTPVADLSALKELKSLTSLDLNNTYVADVSALKELTSLTSLDLSFTKVADVSALKELTSLKRLYLSFTQVADLSALKELKSLASLDLNNTHVGDVSALKGLTSLTSLYLNNTQVADVSALKELKSLTILDLSDTKVVDVSALKELKTLRRLHLSSTQVADVSALKGLTSLTSLYLNNTQVADVSALKELTSLTSLDLNKTHVADVSALKELTSLTSLDLSFTKVADVSALKELTSLTSLDLSFTKVADVSALKELTSLTSLDLSFTKVVDVSALKELTSLTSLNLGGTEVSDVSALKELKSLTSLNLGGTQVVDVSALKELKELKIVR